MDWSLSCTHTILPRNHRDHSTHEAGKAGDSQFIDRWRIVVAVIILCSDDPNPLKLSRTNAKNSNNHEHDEQILFILFLVDGYRFLSLNNPLNRPAWEDLHTHHTIATVLPTSNLSLHGSFRCKITFSHEEHAVSIILIPPGVINSQYG